MSRHAALACVLVAAAAAATLLRVPEIVLEPRFWAEEGRDYFVHALSVPALDALAAEHQGYYSLVPNVAAWLAIFVPLEHAPAVTTAIALLVQMLPVAIVATSAAPWAGEPRRRAVAVLVVLLVGAAGELHATTTNSQFQLALAAAVVYLELAAPIQPARRTALLGVLLLAGLTGVQSTLLAPVFAWRWWRDRQGADAAAAAVLASCLLLQAGVVLSVAGQPDRFSVPREPIGAGLRTVEKLAKGLLIHPIAGDLGPKFMKLPFGAAMLAVGVVGVAAAAVAQLAILRRGPGRDMLAAAWLVAVASYLGSRRMAGGERYLEVSSALIVLAIATLAFDTGRPRALRACAGIAVAAAVVVNAWLYPLRTGGSFDADWPRWTAEVAAWRDGRAGAPRIHPQWADGAWTAAVPDRLRGR